MKTADPEFLRLIPSPVCFPAPANFISFASGSPWKKENFIEHHSAILVYAGGKFKDTTGKLPNEHTDSAKIVRAKRQRASISRTQEGS
jgi:hypothetical protein